MLLKLAFGPKPALPTKNKDDHAEAAAVGEIQDLGLAALQNLTRTSVQATEELMMPNIQQRSRSFAFVLSFALRFT